MTALSMIQSANLLGRFLLELCALGALGYWGLRAHEHLLPKLGLGIGAPLLAAVVWSFFVAPNAPVVLPVPAHLGLQLAVFGSAALGLAAAGRPRLGAALLVVAVVNWALMVAWNQ